MIVEYFVPTKVVMEKGCSEDVGIYAKQYQLSHVLIVSDHGLKRAGFLEPIYQSLEAEQIAYNTFCNVQPNPRDVNCDEAVHQFNGKPIDGILALGGGSVIDAAKAISILMTNGGRTKEYEGMDVASVTPLPIICIPTTAGTGSEVTAWSIITDTTAHYKMAIGDDRIIPKLALLDAQLTASLPASIAASTGMDALTHAIEAYTCNIATPITDGLALHAVKLISESLQDAVYASDNEKARENMLIASLMAGIAFGNADTAGVHCLSEAIGGKYDTPHGEANSIFLPYMFHYNMDADFSRHGDVAYALGVSRNLSPADAAKEAVHVLVDLSERLNIPRFSDIDKVDRKDFHAIAENAVQSSSNAHNVKEMKVIDYVHVLEDAYKGKLG